MKFVLYTPLMLYLLLVTNSYLLNGISLDKDPVYRKVIKRRLTYPPLRYEDKVALMVYARFSIDERGHVHNVKIIKHPTQELYHKLYDAVVESTLKRLPPLNPNYVGHYILPVAFCVRNHDNGELLIPKDVDYYGKHVNSVLLQKVEVIGYKRYVAQN
jgi:hypothetical protein